MFISLDETTIVNTNHIVSMDFSPAEPAYFDEGEQVQVKAKKAKLEITTTAISMEWERVDLNDLPADRASHIASGSGSQVIVLRGETAEKAFQFFSTFDTGDPTKV